MEPNHPNHQRRAFVILLAVLGVLFIYLLRPVLIAVLLASIIVILCYPVYSFFLKKTRHRPYLSSFLATLLVFLVLVLPSGLILALLIKQAVGLLSGLDVGGNLTFLTSKDFYREYVYPFTEMVKTRFNVEIDIGALLTRAGKEALHYLYNFSPQVLSRTLTFAFQFFVMHFSIFFLFIEGKKVVSALMDLSPIKAGYEIRLSGEFKNMIFATVYGYLVTALVQGILAGIGYAIAGVPAPLVFATLTFFMSMVPIVGATAAWLPIAAWLYLTDRTGMGLFMTIYGFVVISGIDNIIKPLIIQGKAKIHPLLIFFSLLGGITFFGPIGILFGPVITSLFFACIRIYREDFLPQVQS